MSTQVKHRRGTASDNASFTGAVGEFTYITDKKRVSAHDGVTAGGNMLLNANDTRNNVGKYGTVGGTANAITLANSDVPATAYTAGMEIIFKPTADNTTAVTVAVDGISGTKAIEKMVAGVSTALAANDLRNGVVARAVYDGTRFQLQMSGGSSISDRQTFNSSGTWNKPSNYDATAMVLIECWGGGGGGGSSSTCGGGGGSYKHAFLPLSSLSSSESVTVGAGGNAGSGGTNGTSGGSSSFGSFCTAYGGAGGTGGTFTPGGSGGGIASTPTAGSRFNDVNLNGGEGIGCTDTIAGSGGYFIGGGGGSGQTGSGGIYNNGKASVYGGGGGGGNGGSGGASQYGGAGGAAGAAGTQPGGAGGAAGAGAAGRVRVTVFG